MKRAAEKLHSRRGASLLYALVLFLAASMISALILSASVTAVKRMNDDREREQEYLLLGSAARLFKKSIEASEVTVTKTVYTYYDGREVDPVTGYGASVGAMGGILQTAMYDKFDREPPKETSYDMILEVKDTGDDAFDKLLRPATLTFSMKDDGTISGKITMPDGSQTIYLSTNTEISSYTIARDVPIYGDPTPRMDPTTNQPLLDPDGNPIMEQNQIGKYDVTGKRWKWRVTLSTAGAGTGGAT